MRLFIVFYLFSLALFAEELYVVANKNFPLKALTQAQVKKIYLKQIDYIHDVAIYPLHLSLSSPLRKLFRKKILQMSTQELKRYWTKAHYQGKQTPFVQNSQEGVLEFIQKVDGAVTYVLMSRAPDNVTILYRGDRE